MLFVDNIALVDEIKEGTGRKVDSSKDLERKDFKLIARRQNIKFVTLAMKQQRYFVQ